MSDVAARCTKSPRRDIGHGVIIEERFLDGRLGGVAYWHTCSEGLPEGYMPINEPGDTMWWALVSLDPLTLSPSILCPACKHHGHIVEGKWVPA